jgi:hypothetical protein
MSWKMRLRINPVGPLNGLVLSGISCRPQKNWMDMTAWSSRRFRVRPAQNTDKLEIFSRSSESMLSSTKRSSDSSVVSHCWNLLSCGIPEKRPRDALESRVSLSRIRSISLWLIPGSIANSSSKCLDVIVGFGGGGSIASLRCASFPGSG